MAGKNLTELLSEQIVLGDGAMGTMLYQEGVFINTCFDELNLKAPSLVKDIHQRYIEAGCDFIETNTFGANEVKLAGFGLADKLEEINGQSATIAKEAAGDEVLVGGAIGPIGREITAHSQIRPEEASSIFERQGLALAKAGVDFFILETFSQRDELLAAIRGVRRAADIPIIAQLTINVVGQTPYG